VYKLVVMSETNNQEVEPELTEEEVLENLQTELEITKQITLMLAPLSDGAYFRVLQAVEVFLPCEQPEGRLDFLINFLRIATPLLISLSDSGNDIATNLLSFVGPLFQGFAAGAEVNKEVNTGLGELARAVADAQARAAERENMQPGPAPAPFERGCYWVGGSGIGERCNARRADGGPYCALHKASALRGASGCAWIDEHDNLCGAPRSSGSYCAKHVKAFEGDDSADNEPPLA
jgi:hypothetical protein